jgi:N-acetylmuramoyl-L-alanine amidase
VRPRPEPKPRPRRRTPRGLVVLDAGHGGRDTGAIGVDGAREKDFTHALTALLAERLGARGIDVRLTRRGDEFIELDDRAEFANKLDADLFVSIHANAVGTRRHVVHGYQIYVARQASRQTLQAADAVCARLDAAGVDCWGRQPKRADFRVLVGTSCPALLVEAGFLTHPGDARLLASEGHRRTLADSIAEGIVAHLSR